MDAAQVFQYVRCIFLSLGNTRRRPLHYYKFIRFNDIQPTAGSAKGGYLDPTVTVAAQSRAPRVNLKAPGWRLPRPGGVVRGLCLGLNFAKLGETCLLLLG